MAVETKVSHMNGVVEGQSCPSSSSSPSNACESYGGSFIRIQKNVIEKYGDAIDRAMQLGMFTIPMQDGEDITLPGFQGQCLQSVVESFALYRSWLARLFPSCKKDETQIENKNEENEDEYIPVVLIGDCEEEGRQIAGKRMRYLAMVYCLRTIRIIQVLIEMFGLRGVKNVGAFFGLAGVDVPGDRRKGISSPSPLRDNDDDLIIERFRHLSYCGSLELVKLVLKFLIYRFTPFDIFVDDEAVEEWGKKRWDELSKRRYLEQEAAKSVGRSGAEYNLGQRSRRRLRKLADPSVCDDTNGIIGKSSSKTSSIFHQVEEEAKEKLAKEAGVSLSHLSKAKAPCATVMIKRGWQFSKMEILGEVCYHVRPFIQLYLLYKRKRWTSWFTSFVLDFVSVCILHLRGWENKSCSPPSGEDQLKLHLQVGEINRRKRLLLWALFRSPMFEMFTHIPVDLLNRIWKRIPLLKYFNIMDFYLILRPYYFTTSGT